MKYRKKPLEVEAEMFTGPSIVDFCPDAVVRMMNNTWYAAIRTKEGVMEAREGDFIIKGIEGEFYPCKSSVFTASYVPAL